ncbi:MAG: glycerate kinase [Bacillota bacterium]|nr:glycerate kinase [Bacillota bacterium]
MRIVVAPDSFKGNLSSIEIADAIEKGIRNIDQSIQVIKIPVADGGEGSVETLVNATGGRIIPVRVTGPLLREVNAFYGISGDGQTSFIEMAAASGLSLLKQNEYNAMKASSYGTGELILDALDQGCRKIIIGLGGSATNDGGAGLLQALGMRLYDRYQFDLALGGGSLGDLFGFNQSQFDPRIKDTTFLLACDVDNPLCGPHGASHVYGPQKGASPEDVLILDENLKHFAQVIEKTHGKQIEDVPGAGSAGGMGGGLMAFLDAHMVKGIDLVMEACNIETAIADADLVITGEGKIDTQTACGKAPLGIAQMAMKYDIPVIGIAGALGEDIKELYTHGFTSLFAIANRPMSLDESLSQAEALIEKQTENLMRLFLAGKQ